MKILLLIVLLGKVAADITVQREVPLVPQSDVKLEAEKPTEEPKKNDASGLKKSGGSKMAGEDSIPVIEIKGEGKPMTAAQIRQLEEEADGKPADIKIKYTWKPQKCPSAAKRKDFITFNFKCYLEDGKKIEQSYGRAPVRLQLGVGMMMPGLDKGIRGMCHSELRNIKVPWRLSRKKKSKVWRGVPNEEHWLSFDIEMMHVEPWSHKLQFEYMDLNNDSYLTTNELTKWAEKMRKEFGKHWPNEDIDNVNAAKYYIKYFDTDKDGKVNLEELTKTMKDDYERMSVAAATFKKDGKKPKGRKRDPGLAWVLDFNNDGVVTMDEIDAAADIFEEGPQAAANAQSKSEKDEL